MTYNVWCKWHPLKTVLLGSPHPKEFFDNIKNPNIRGPLQRITEETQEDLDYFEQVLKQYGCNVLKAETLYTEKDITRYPGQIPRNALQPRDTQLVMGNKLIMFKLDNLGIQKALMEYNKKDIIRDPEILNIGKLTETSHMGRIEAPCITVIGDKVLLDRSDGDTTDVTNWLKDTMPEFEYKDIYIGGHSDGVFHTLKPGVMLALHDIETYKDNFKNWDICYLPDQHWDALSEFRKIKHKVKGKWWLPGEEDNDDFTHYVNSWLNDWVGYVEETVFDVNVLMLDHRFCCLSNLNNKTVIKFLEKHHIEPIHIPWRHRYFWDGGLHCITLDLERKGSKESVL
tara:strand:+ start:338 stop:1360 length:1023 start_codon:yes stop_codon:yes gene_type:complete